jgi:C-terminal processing protease CtpA/Prc
MLVSGIAVSAQDMTSGEDLDEYAHRRNQEIFSLWQQKAYADVLVILKELYNTPRMNETEYAWTGILYNTACIYSLVGNPDSALLYLDKAIDAGYINYDHLLSDSDLDPLRSDERFTKLVARVRHASQFWNNPAIATAYSENISEEEKLAGLAKFWMEIKLNFVFFHQVPHINWDSLFLTYLRKVRQTGSTLQYFRVLQEMCAHLHDGHTSLTPPRELWPILWSSPEIVTKLIEEKVLITKVKSDSLLQMGIHVGMEVTAISGIETKEYAERFVRPYMSASTPQGLDVQTYTYSLLDGPEEETVELTLRDSDGNVLDVTVPRKYGFSSVPPAEFSMLESDIAYFDISTFSTDSVVTIFDSVFDSVQLSKGLIIDVRRNGGGNSGVGWNLLGYLTDSSFSTLRSEVRAYSPKRRYEGRGPRWETTFWNHPAHGSKLYAGPVAVLAGPFSGSAAEDFLVAFDAIKRGVIIGELSYGSTGQPMSFPLPGGITARVCIKRCTYPGGKEYVGVGVLPDIVVKQSISDIRDNRDRVLEAAVEYLKDNVK